jgi:hypothetical protein
VKNFTFIIQIIVPIITAKNTINGIVINKNHFSVKLKNTEGIINTKARIVTQKIELETACFEVFNIVLSKSLPFKILST